MPLYDFECPMGHRFEKLVSMSEASAAIPCEQAVPQMVKDTAVEDPPVVMVACPLEATRIFGTHSNPSAMLDHGSSSNRDAAREGRYDPLNPSRRFMAKGRRWRK